MSESSVVQNSNPKRLRVAAVQMISKDDIREILCPDFILQFRHAGPVYHLRLLSFRRCSLPFGV